MKKHQDDTVIGTFISFDLAESNQTYYKHKNKCKTYKRL